MIIVVTLLALILLMGILLISCVTNLIEEGYEFEEYSLLWFITLGVCSLIESVAQGELE